MAAAALKILLAPDSFKDCLPAVEVASAMAAGIRARVPNALIVTKPMADGGEGTIAAIAAAVDSDLVATETTDALGRKCPAQWLWLSDAQTAFVETAQACGLERLLAGERRPLETTTFGAGRLLQQALQQRPRRVVLTIGGSATVDGGVGLAQALGYRFLDRHGRELAAGGGALAELAEIVPPAARAWDGVELVAACDVDNPLLGERGAAAVFGPQKGAGPAEVARLETGLQRLHERWQTDLGIDTAALPGAGAAGGMGAGLVAFFGAALKPGVELVAELTGLAAELATADLVLTGEGRTDSQSAGGKVCAGVARLARRHGVRCVVISGAVSGELTALYALGVTAVFSISPGPQSLAAAMAGARTRLAAVAGDVAALLAGNAGP